MLKTFYKDLLADLADVILPHKSFLTNGYEKYENRSSRFEGVLSPTLFYTTKKLVNILVMTTFGNKSLSPVILKDLMSGKNKNKFSIFFTQKEDYNRHTQVRIMTVCFGATDTEIVHKMASFDELVTQNLNNIVETAKTQDALQSYVPIYVFTLLELIVKRSLINCNTRAVKRV